MRNVSICIEARYEQGAWKQLIANTVVRVNALVVTSSDRGYEEVRRGISAAKWIADA
jgi:hypothetical protein